MVKLSIYLNRRVFIMNVDWAVNLQTNQTKEVWYYMSYCSMLKKLLCSFFFFFFFFFLPTLMSEMYNSGNSTVDISKITYFGWLLLGLIRAEKIIDYQSCHCDR